MCGIDNKSITRRMESNTMWIVEALGVFFFFKSFRGSFTCPTWMPKSDAQDDRVNKREIEAKAANNIIQHIQDGREGKQKEKAAIQSSPVYTQNTTQTQRQHNTSNTDTDTTGIRLQHSQTHTQGTAHVRLALDPSTLKSITRPT